MWRDDDDDDGTIQHCIVHYLTESNLVISSSILFIGRLSSIQAGISKIGHASDKGVPAGGILCRFL
jgi:hypothetical protein